MIVAQVSDPHVGVDPATGQGLTLAVARLAEMDPPPECVLLTGDLVAEGVAEEYARLREMLAPLPMPVHPIPGNHDSREALRAAFADHPLVAPSDGFVQYVVELDGLRVVMCDTKVDGAQGGAMDGPRLTWLDTALSGAGGVPTLVALHHPPFETGIAAMDAIGLDGADDLAALLARHPSVCLVVCAHVHRTAMASCGGHPVFLCPSTALAITLDLRPGAPGTLVREPPAFALHVHRGGGEIVTHVQPLGDFGEPFGEV